MSGDYLWDRSGPPDPEIERLERLLAPLRHRGEFRFPATRAPRQWWAAAAAAILIALAAWQFLPRPSGRKTSWELLTQNGRPTPLYAGQVLRTGRAATLTLNADDVGRIDVAPESELRVATDHRMNLPRGRIHVLIWAPPRRFVVDTPSARAIDLGCQYTLAVDPRGNGLVQVETGWVAFQFRGLESFIPAGAACNTNRRLGPGTPWFRDASEELRRSIAIFDDTGDGGALSRVLAEARPRDGLTLWHLLTRVPAVQRAAVFDRFSALVPLPPEVTRAGVLAGDTRILDLCWNALGLENTDWWREWKRPWQP